MIIILFLAAKRVIEKGMHKIGENEFYFKALTRKTEETGQSCDANFEQNTVEICGDVTDLKEVLEMYLENEKRSGGGEIEKIDFDTNPPSVVFSDGEGNFLN